MASEKHIEFYIFTGNLTSVKRIQKVNFSMTKTVLSQLNQVRLFLVDLDISTYITTNTQWKFYIYNYRPHANGNFMKKEK